MITHCLIQSVRNISMLEFYDLYQMNLIVGPNGCGKTSILEAIYFLSLGRSFRTSSYKKIIQRDKKHLLVHGVLDHETKLGIQKDYDGTLTVRIDGESYSSIAECTLHMPVQVIDPEAFRLLQDGPEQRRKFLDWGVYQKFPSFIRYWRDYQRLLKQRNAAIRSQLSTEMVSMWDKQIIEATLSIDELRKSYIESFSPIFESYFKKLLPDLDIQLGYYRGWSDSEDFESVLSERFLKDMELGYTFSGPHRFDLKLKTNAQIAADVFSRGQQKLTVIALKLAQSQLCSQEAGKLILLLDDIAAELDAPRRTLLAELISELNCQTFVTGVEEQLLAPFHTESAKVIFPESLLN